MPLDNEQISTKLAVMENQISTLVQSSQRVEALLERISLFDKTQSELLQRYTYLNERHIETSTKVDKCAESHEKETVKLWSEVTELKDKANKAHGIGLGAMAFAGVIACIATYFFTFLFSTAQENKAGNIRQDQQIIQIEKELQK
jgi:pyridoxine 5'-phosphate synthase PdxJ